MDSEDRTHDIVFYVLYNRAKRIKVDSVRLSTYWVTCPELCDCPPRGAETVLDLCSTIKNLEPNIFNPPKLQSAAAFFAYVSVSVITHPFGWYQLIKLITHCSEWVIYRLKEHDPDEATKIAGHLAEYIIHNYCAWIDLHGGWKAINVWASNLQPLTNYRKRRTILNEAADDSGISAPEEEHCLHSK